MPKTKETVAAAIAIMIVKIVVVVGLVYAVACGVKTLSTNDGLVTTQQK